MTEGGRPAARREEARERFSRFDIEALVVTRLENVRYLSGFTGSSGALLITADKTTLFTDGRYAQQAAAESSGVGIEITRDIPSRAAAAHAGDHRLGFESDAVPHSLWERMRSLVGDKTGGVLVPCVGLVEKLRMRKSPDELQLIRRAVDIAANAFEGIRDLIRPGVEERELALELEFRMKNDGAEEVAFGLIVASGFRSALPHGRASEKALGTGEFVVFDIGARYEGYHSDMTRTVFIGGRPGPRSEALYKTVRSAQQRGVEAVGPGVKAADVDRAAREVIEQAGFGDLFTHGTGHGVGLQVHEAPRVAAASREVLEPGMVVTVEPGVYVPGEGGVRIEDIVVVTETGREVLTPTSKDDWVLE